ncbi:MAG TPA: hypothetical protein VG275_07175 [Solirubrobacteraceae bacterium]|jgi:hypothetical protein|nr:hypothetical protein [Solirubrobacteraceae bacterium]
MSITLEAPVGRWDTFDRSLAQRLDALQRANDVRTDRAKLKRNVKAGRIHAGYVLTSPPPEAQTMKVYDLLLAVPKYGRVKTNKALALARISPAKTVGGLTERQSYELAGWLGYRTVFGEEEV